MQSLEQRIQQLEDIEAIRYLKHYYFCHCVDLGVAGDASVAEKIASRLTDDVALDFTGMPLFEGRNAVLQFLTVTVPDLISWCQHRVLNEVIDVEGDTARGVWYVDCPVVYREGKIPELSGSCMVTGRYEEEYRRQNGLWHWSKIVALVDVQQSFEINWSNASRRVNNRELRESA